MIIEEIVKQIQNGNDDLYTDLWEQTHRFIELQAAKYCRKFEQCGIDQNGNGTIVGGVSIDDLCQAGFFALRKAVEGFDPSLGYAFLTYLGTKLRAAFDDCCGLHTGRRRIYIGEDGKTHERQIPDPLNNCDSLDAPVPGADDIPLSDTLPDKRDYYEEVEEKLYTDQLHASLDHAIRKLPIAEGTVLRQEYFVNRARSDIAKDLHVSQQSIARLHNRGLRLIRISSSRRNLEAFLDEHTDFYAGMGGGTFAITQERPVEQTVMHRDRVGKRFR